MALAAETTSLTLLSLVLFAIIHAGFVRKVNAEEVLDPVRISNHLANPVQEKKFDSFLNGFGEAKRSFDEINRSAFGFNKRPNFDEIGRSSFGFNKRRNFDEIGRSAFGFTKRLPYGLLTEYDDAAKQTLMKRANFDEIGRSSFGFYRRSPVNARSAGWRFFSGFGKRNAIPNYDAVNLDETTDNSAQKRGFDEISRSSFGFTRR